MSEETAVFVFLEIKNDKDRGNVILTIRNAENDNVCFFQWHHQPVRQHPEKIQQIVTASRPTTRTKTIKVDISDFLRQYWNGSAFEFKGVELNSMNKEKTKVYERLVNKEVGVMKRKLTIEIAKKEKSDEKAKKIRQRFEADEDLFQAKRAKRIAELFKDRPDQME